VGLTIHNKLKLTGKDPRKVIAKVRQLALDLPFEEVGELLHLRGQECDCEARRTELKGTGPDRDETLFWFLIQSRRSVALPWNKRRYSVDVAPKEIVGFTLWPGPGCEASNIGLCRYPETIEVTYKPEDDQRFQEKAETKGWTEWTFSWPKYRRWLAKHGAQPTYAEQRLVPIQAAGWSWSSFCKTQYASDPACGGVANFLRCHVSVITLLERIAKIDGVSVRIDDEGKYGSSTYSDDYKEASAAGLKPTYRRHKGRYSPAALVKELGEWNEAIAALSGSLTDALGGNGMTLAAPIKNFANFEALEFRCHKNRDLRPFLDIMRQIAEEARDSRAKQDDGSGK
jgi:hypothetical protein